MEGRHDSEPRRETLPAEFQIRKITIVCYGIKIGFYKHYRPEDVGMTDEVIEDLTTLTTKQQAMLKVLADADGEALWGVEIRKRLKQHYNIDLTRNGMNGVFRSNSRYPKYMTEIKWVDEDEIDGNTKHVSHRLKSEYIDKVRKQLQ